MCSRSKCGYITQKTSEISTTTRQRLGTPENSNQRALARDTYTRTSDEDFEERYRLWPEVHYMFLLLKGGGTNCVIRVNHYKVRVEE
jgi:hypothetical protein